MWDLRIANPFGGLSMRKFFLCATALTVAILAYIFITAPPTYAADANWNGAVIVYNGQKYASVPDAKAGDGTNLPPGSKMYMSTEAPGAGSGDPQKAHVIYFPPGTDPSQATTANYITYDFTPPNIFKNPSGQQQITIAQSTDNQETTSCDSTFTLGIGWIVCPITNFLAGAMDWLFGILSSFLAVRPAQVNQDTPLYRAWSMMRNFANAAFVVGFLVIIYSQLSNIGLSNYNVKKMLPRLIIAAILVNVSYWICAVAIDISNILGYSIQDLFIAMRNNLVGGEGNGWDVVSWKSITSFILSGGAATAGLGFAGYAAIAGAGGAIYLLIPVLMSVLMAVLVALLVLAARQAIITVLVILSPLAFVAYLLPNTEKYFEKWRELGTTMLVMFPLFSIIFGGSQLAGIAIIQNADSINLIILGMGVQVAPVVVTPLLVRFSGSLLGRLAGIVNNPNKGIIDRTRKWSQERAAQHKDRAIANGGSRLARGARAIDNRRRKREGWQKANQAAAEANWAGTKDYSNIQQYAMQSALAKEGHEAAVQERFERSKHTNAAIQGIDITARANKLKLDLSKATTEANWEEIQAGRIDSMVTPAALAGSALYNAQRRQQQTMADQIQHNTLESAVENRRLHSAKEHQQQHFTEQLLGSVELQRRAGGIAENGADSALAAAIAEKRKAFGQSVAEAHEILKHLNLSGDQRQKLAMDGNVTVVDPSTGATKVFTPDSTHAREAAIEAQMRGEGNFKQIQDIVLASGSSLANFKTTIGDEIAKNKLVDKAAYLGGQTINQVKQGDIKGDVELDIAVARTIAQGKIKPVQLATMDVDAVRRVLKVAKTGSTTGLSAEDGPKLARRIAALGVSAQEALKNPTLSGQMADNVKDELDKFVAQWPPPPNP